MAPGDRPRSTATSSRTRPSYDMWPQIPLCAPAQAQACHAFELPFVFGNPTTIVAQPSPAAHSFTAAEQSLSDRIMAYWTSFARTLEPNREGAPQWPGFFAGPASAPDPRPGDLDQQRPGGNCTFWDSLGYTGIRRAAARP